MHIRTVYAKNRGAFGWPRIWRELRAQGIRVGKLRVQQLMQRNGIRASGKRRFRITTTDSRHDLPIAPNPLDRNFMVEFKLKQASAVLGVPAKDLQNLVQLKVIRPARRDNLYWFDSRLLLEAKLPST